MADHSPPREWLPTRSYILPEFASYADRFNPTEELLALARWARSSAKFQSSKGE